MRYIHRNSNACIITETGAVLHQFVDGVLVVGSTITASGGGNAIDPNLSATDAKDRAMIMPSLAAAATPLEKIGLNVLFFEAPELSVANSNATLVADKWYKVLYGGTITHDNKTYKVGQRFKATASGAFTGTGVVALDLPEEYYKSHETDHRVAAFEISHLVAGDVNTYDTLTGTMGSETFTGIK